MAAHVDEFDMGYVLGIARLMRGRKVARPVVLERVPDAMLQREIERRLEFARFPLAAILRFMRPGNSRLWSGAKKPFVA